MSHNQAPDERPSALLHRLTSYELGRDWTEAAADERLVKSFEPNDLDRLPWFYKRYPPGLERRALPRALPQVSADALLVLAGAHAPAKAHLDLAGLARLLHLSAGVVRTTERPYGTYLFRAAGSAGGRFPLEVYLAVPEGSTLPPGVYHYEPLAHELVHIGPAPGGEAPTLVVTGVPWRSAWRYRERAFRHLYWDAGTMLAQLWALAASAGLQPRLYTSFADAQVAALVGADRVHEFPLFVLALGAGELALQESGRAARGEVDRAPVELPLVVAAQRAGEGDALGRPWDEGPPVEVDPAGRALDEVVLARGSQRIMDARRALPVATLRACVAVATRGVSLAQRVAVHAVEGMPCGLYRWPELSVPARPGSLRAELYRVCLNQALARDAAFVVLSVAALSQLDDHGYRAAQLAAGLVSGRLHLAAYALGASASGMTFIDAEVPSLLGEELDALLFTCVGVPAYQASPGGPPGAPTAVRMVQPRSTLG